MIDVARVDRRAMVEQVAGDVDRRGEVERGLAVAAARVHQRRVGRQQCVEPVDHAVPGGGVDVDHRATFEQERHQRSIVVEHAEAAGPPVAARVDVGAGLEQQVGHLAVVPVDGNQQRRGPEGLAGHRLVQAGREIRRTGEHPAGRIHLAGANRCRKRLESVGVGHDEPFSRCQCRSSTRGDREWGSGMGSRDGDSGMGVGRGIGD